MSSGGDCFLGDCKHFTGGINTDTINNKKIISTDYREAKNTKTMTKKYKLLQDYKSPWVEHKAGEVKPASDWFAMMVCGKRGNPKPPFDMNEESCSNWCKQHVSWFAAEPTKFPSKEEIINELYYKSVEYRRDLKTDFLESLEKHEASIIGQLIEKIGQMPDNCGVRFLATRNDLIEILRNFKSE